MAQASTVGMLVNASIFCRTKNQFLLPWRILHMGQPGHTVEQFFHDVAATHIESTSSTRIILERAYLGRSKDNLDQIDLSVTLDSAVPLFGGFLRYITTQSKTQTNTSTSRSAFDILMPVASKKGQSQNSSIFINPSPRSKR